VNDAMDDQERRARESEDRWEREFGPPISPLRKWLTGLFIIAAFFAIIALALISGPTR
jgi:hypothetical protein